MTTTYDHRHPAYFDEADMRGELTRVFDLCHGCRMCFNLCPSFPTLFDFVDGHDGEVEAMTEAEQDQVVDECYQCKLCYVKCPYIPPHEWALDFPRLIMRAKAVKQRRHEGPVTERIAVKAMGKPDVLGRLAGGPAAPLANAALKSGAVRQVVEKTAGIAAERLLPPYAKTRFTTWFKRRARAAGAVLGQDRRARAAVFPTCFVEYMQPDIGQDLVKVYERNGVECSLASTANCCAAPLLHGGDVDGFTRAASKNVKALAQDVRQGRDVVVPQPTCGYVLKRDYPLYVGDEAKADAELVAQHTYDAAEYLMKLHREGGGLDTEFGGEVPESVTYHVPCHLQAQNIGLKSRDLLKLTGTKITLANKCSGIDGTWGYRAENYELARKVAQPLAEAVEKAGSEVVAGDCHLANGAIVQETGRRPLHPLQVVARAYGIPEEEEGRGWGRS